ncbi:AGAP012692-PA-like protein [Anopheles sinensis]|uniref:AGAP012692-PA-like protein n=1 Tax=Anopheles sinensis TaxID=74873 RepID=A0A084W8I7_ANOSI|nr:AGAP012692-PA-like protein [Anopheles sinensis]
MKQTFGLVFFALLFGCVLAGNKPESVSAKGTQSGRVVNGTSVSSENYPFVVSMHRYLGGFFCAASIITDKHALTAGHCLVGNIVKPADFVLIGGSSYVDSGILFFVSNYSVHPKYSVDNDTADYDAAIVTIDGTFDNFTNIAPISLPKTAINYSRNNPTWCYVVGWGRTDGKMPTYPETLQHAWMQVVSQYKCQQIYIRKTAITSRMICADLPNTSACYGDSGGPLVCNGELTGIVSWGSDYCSGQPSVFAKVDSTSIREFIKEIAGI